MSKKSTEGSMAMQPEGKSEEKSEGKSYGYQRPQETLADTSNLVAHKQRVVDAFDAFMDVLLHRGGSGAGGAGGASGTGGSSGTGGAASGTVGGAASSGGASGSSGAGGAASGTASGGAGTGGSTGSGSGPAGLGYLTPTGTTGGMPGRPGAGYPGSTVAGGSAHYPGTAGERPIGEAGTAFGGTEATMSIGAQREAFRLDRVREAVRRVQPRSESAGGTQGTSSGGPALLTVTANKHLSDSNRAPVTESREFPPMFGSAGKPTAPTMEKMAAPSTRPETVPAGGTVNLGRPIDAYFGSYGTAIEKAAARAKASYTILESIIGNDDRVRVTNNKQYPWCCVCSLLITAANGAQFIGTGWLVSPRLVLTAGHCVFMADEDGWASQIEVIPGRNATERPFGSAISRELRSVTGFTQDNDSHTDYGAIILPADKRYGEQLGWFGYATRDDDYLKSITVNLAGYPGDGGKAGQQVDGSQWYNFRTINDVMDRQITYEIDTYGGQSGAPVWEMTSNGSRYGVAIHTWGTSTANGATRITKEVFDNIVLWAGQAP